MRLAPLLLLPLLAATPAPPPAPATPTAAPAPRTDGTRFRFVQKTESRTSRGPSSRELRGKVLLGADGRFRIDFEKGMGMVTDGAWMVSGDGGRTIDLVFPPDEARRRPKGTIARVDVAATMEAVGAAMKDMQGFAKFSASAPVVRVTRAPGTVTLLGLPARKTTVEISYRLDTTFQGATTSIRTRSVTDYWMTEALGDWALPMLDGRLGLRTGFPEIDRILEAEGRELRGLPLKMKGTTETTDSAGNTTNSDQTLMVLDLRREKKIDPSSFRLPDDYRTIDPVSLLTLTR